MTTAIAPPKAGPKKRGQGRPTTGGNDVGRERLLAAAEHLLRTMPSARVTIARVAQEAAVDPALVRYYFGSRTGLLVAVVDRVTAHAARGEPLAGEPTTVLADHITRTVQLVRGAPFMHRLMIDELADAGTGHSRDRVRAMNLDLVDFYRQLLSADGGAALTAADPLLLHLVVLGASDFFTSAEPLISALLPEGTDFEALTARFQQFLVDVVLNGLRKR